MSARVATRIRTVGADALDAVMTIMDEAFDPRFGEAWTRAQCAGVLGMSGTWLSVAEREGEAAGFALARAIVDEGELLLIAVRPAFRRQGLAAELIGHLVVEAGTRGLAALHLEARAENPAHRLYRSLGFVEVGRRRGYYRGREGALYDAITCRKTLMPAQQTLPRVALTG